MSKLGLVSREDRAGKPDQYQVMERDSYASAVQAALRSPGPEDYCWVRNLTPEEADAYRQKRLRIIPKGSFDVDTEIADSPVSG